MYNIVLYLVSKGGGVMDPQLRRGILEVCVLSAIKNKDLYGYKIIKELSGNVEISESTLYPILKRLKTAGMVREYSVEHNGRLRKYYGIEPEGIKRIEEFLGEWQEMLRAYEYIEGEWNNE